MEPGKTYILRRPKKGKNAESQHQDTQSQKSGYVVAVYVRVSTLHEDQLISLKNQQELLQDMSQYLPPELRKTGNVDDVIFYTDAGVTGTHAEIRPEFQHMVADAKLGKVDIVSVKNISRFARSLKDAIRYITELTDSKIPVYFREEGLYNFGENFGLMFSLLSSIAEQESTNTSSHIMATLNEYMRTGVKVNRSAPFGYDCQDRPDLPQKRILVPNADAKVVKKIFDWYLSGYTTPQISELLKDTYGVIKRSTTIATMLHNPAYCGLLVQRKSYTEGVRGRRVYTEEGILSPYKHEAIISEEDFTKVQEICYQRAHVPEARSCAVPLTGLIRCGRCGCTFVRHADRGMTAWACSSYQKNVTCPGKSIKTTHDDTIKRLYAEAVYLLKADAKRYGQGHYTLDQINGVEEIDEDCDKIRSYVKGITIGSEKVDRLVTFEFLCGAYVQFETTPTDVHYRKELIIRLWAK